MSAPRFSTIPTELICQVFESLHVFSEVAALARTERIFHQIWRRQAASICRAVGFRSFPNFIEAERLLDTQEEADGESQTQDSGEERARVRAKRLLSNARCAAAALADWVDFCQIQDTGGSLDRGPEGSPETYMQPEECARFDKTFYSLWTIAVMQSTPHMRHHAIAFLNNCTV